MDTFRTTLSTYVDSLNFHGLGRLLIFKPIIELVAILQLRFSFTYALGSMCHHHVVVTSQALQIAFRTPPVTT